jgi:hypothetical protein
MALRLLNFLPDDGYHNVNDKLPEPNTQLYICCAKNADNVGGGAATFGEDGKWYWSYDYMRSYECVYPVTEWSYMCYPGPDAETMEWLKDKYADEIENMYKPECEHHFYIPHHGMCCGYYSKTVDAYGMGYAHYPDCKKENCPFAHPELVAGRKLESEIEARCKMVGMIPIAERDNKRCYFCGAKLSVKYLVEVDMPAKAPEPFRVHSCNKCALIKIR